VQQQHVSFFAVDTIAVKSGSNRETWFAQRQPPHQQSPAGAAVLKSTATIATQATHCRNENNLITLIISSPVGGVNNVLRENRKISPIRQFLGYKFPLFMVK
jgi:hypothetical protein